MRGRKFTHPIIRLCPLNVSDDLRNVLFAMFLIFTGAFKFCRRKQQEGDLLSYIDVQKMLGTFGLSVLGQPQDCDSESFDRLLVKILSILPS